MQHYQHIKEDYKFSKEEAQVLRDLQPKMEGLVDTFLDEFYDHILGSSKKKAIKC